MRRHSTGDRTFQVPLSRRLLDAVGYAVGLTLVAVVVAVPPGFALWGGLPGVKFGLFLIGFAYFGYASLLLQPSRPTDDDPDLGREETTFEELLHSVPPMDRVDVPLEARYSPGAKLMLASLLTLAVSFVMEAALGVAAAS